MTINYWAVLVCSVFAMFWGYVWYGPIFKKKWLEVIKANEADLAARSTMEKGIWKLYITQFLLAFFQIWVLAYYIAGWTEASGVVNALWIWAAFVMPTIAGTAMWNNDSTKIAWTRFLIQSGYQLICFVVFGLILGFWT